MATLTGSHGALRYNGTLVAKVSQFSIDLNRDAIEDTPVGVWDRTYVKGLRGATGSANIFYDLSDPTAGLLFDNIYDDSDTTVELTFELSTTNGKYIKASGFLTSVSPSVSAGSAQAMSINFQISGPSQRSF